MSKNKSLPTLWARLPRSERTKPADEGEQGLSSLAISEKIVKVLKAIRNVNSGRL
jgi:hypothetical protein